MRRVILDGTFLIKKSSHVRTVGEVRIIEASQRTRDLGVTVNRESRNKHSNFCHILQPSLSS